MTDKHESLEGAEPEREALDDRMARVLRGETTSQAMRRKLADEQSEESEDLLARLDALDFVQQVVGGTSDVPARIADYRIKGLLGRGGMGTVYLAYQEDLDREVALKVLSPTYSADPTMRKRFRAEARATAAMHHRHIVPIYDYGEAQGMLFFTMERVDGMSLDKHISSARRLKRMSMEPLEAAHRFAGVADALGLAHRRRLLHRDVKPGNILVAEDGTLALTDFGLAKALDQASARLTSKGGGFLGTLHYSSPEQALGGELSQASDLYSLGVTLFETVAGELPFAAKTTEALLQSILQGSPRRLREVVPKVPRDLDAVCEKLLSREPADRYQDGEALSRDLVRIGDGEPVHIRRLPLHVRVYRRARKNPLLASAVAAASVLLLVTMVLLTFLNQEKGQSLASRHQNFLVQIATDIGNELGPVSGPPSMLKSLTGIDHSDPEPNAAVLQALQRAYAEMPADAQVTGMRDAYVDDPLPVASALLRAGRGYEALLAYDRAISDSIALRTGGQLDLAVELQLYGLYIGRGVTNLTSAVGRINEARTDLALAAYLRPGAAFPRSLLSVLDVAQSADVADAALGFERDLAQAAPERVQIIGQLLWTVAGLQPLLDANLMRFPLRHSERLALHRLAGRLLQEAPAGVASPREPGGLAGRLANLVRDALDRLADPTALRVATERARAEIMSSVHPASPLRGWGGVLQLIEQPLQRGDLLGLDGRPLPPTLQLAAWGALLQLVPKRETVALWLPRFEELARSHPNLPGLLPIAAQIHLLAGSVKTAELIDAWMVEADGEPDVQFARMQLRLRDADFTGALDDAMVAVQASVDRQMALAEVVRLCDVVSDEVGAPTSFGIFTVKRSFSVMLEGSEVGR